MADKDTDRPENKTLTAHLKKAAKTVAGEDTAPRIFGRELRKRITVRDSVLVPILGTMVAANFGSVIGTFAYDSTEHDRPAPTHFSQALGGYGFSYQALRAGDQTYLIVSQGIRSGTTATRHYSVYTQARDNEFHYVADPATALGHFYRISQALEAQKDALTNGRRLDRSSQVDFYSVKRLSALHEEESGSLERSFNSIEPSSDANERFAEYVTQTSTHVQEAMNNILADHQYGDLEDSSTVKYVSRDDYGHEGGAIAIGLALAYLAGAPLAGAALATRRRRKDGPKPS